MHIETVGTTFIETTGNPDKGQYRISEGLGIAFSSTDAKKKVTIAFKARKRRIAILPVINQTQNEDVPATAASSLSGCFDKLQYEIIPNEEVLAAIREEAINFDPVITAQGEQPSAKDIAAFAKRLNAMQIILVGVSLDKEKITNLWGATVKQEVMVCVDAVLYEGTSGKCQFSRKKTGKGGSNFWTGSTTGTRKSLVTDLLKATLTEYYGSIPSEQCCVRSLSTIHAALLTSPVALSLGRIILLKIHATCQPHDFTRGTTCNRQIPHSPLPTPHSPLTSPHSPLPTPH